MEVCEYTLEHWIIKRNEAYFNALPQASNVLANRILVHQALQIFMHIVDGVEYIHELKCIHRDLKPSNVFWKCREDVSDHSSLNALYPLGSILNPSKPKMFPVDEILENTEKLSGDWKIGDFGLVSGPGEEFIDENISPFSPIETNTEISSRTSRSKKTTGIGTYLVCLN
jgi:serine/threonine protein kinase